MNSCVWMMLGLEVEMAVILRLTTGVNAQTWELNSTKTVLDREIFIVVLKRGWIGSS